jgi:Nuclease-related domain
MLLAIGFGVGGFLADGEWRLVLGIAAGLFLGTWMWLREAAPARIQNWRWGSEGERKTAKELRRLPATDFKVWHDLQWDDQTNIDHVVVGSSGVFLLDTKDCFGHITVDKVGLHFQWLEDPDEVTDYRGIFAKEGGAGAALKAWIADKAGVTTWVNAVVVLWGQYDQGPTEVDNVSFVHGDDLVGWLLARPSARRGLDRVKLGDALDQAAREGLGRRHRFADLRSTSSPSQAGSPPAR